MTNKEMMEELANPKLLDTGCNVVFIVYLVMFVVLVVSIIRSGKRPK